MANRAAIPKADLYPQVRRWYARDRGESTLREVLAGGYRLCAALAGDAGVSGSGVKSSPGLMKRSISTLY